MNQENYKAIAEIMKNLTGNFGNYYFHKETCEKLADYFEKEDNGIIEFGTKLFSRKQFLEWCGVK